MEVRKNHPVAMITPVPCPLSVSTKTFRSIGFVGLLAASAFVSSPRIIAVINGRWLIVSPGAQRARFNYLIMFGMKSAVKNYQNLRKCFIAEDFMEKNMLFNIDKQKIFPDSGSFSGAGF